MSNLKNRIIVMKRIINIFALLLCVCIVSCDDDSKELSAIGISVIERDEDITAAGGTMIVNLSAEGDKVVSDKDWCKVSIEGKMVTVTLDANLDIEGRTAMVSVIKGEHKISFPVSQPSNKRPVPETESLSFGADAETKRVSVDYNAPFQVQLEAGVTWLDAKVEGNSVVFVTQNNYTEHRLSTTVKLISGKLENSIRVMQEGLLLIPEKTEQVMFDAGGKVTIQVNSTRPFTAVSDAEWLVVTSDDSSVTLTADDNAGNPARTATVTLSSEGLKATIAVVQRFPVYADYLGEWLLTPEGGGDEYAITIEQNVENSTYRVKGWGKSTLAANYPLAAKFDAAKGQICITTQKNIGIFSYNGAEHDVCFYGKIEVQPGQFSYVTGSYDCYIGTFQGDGTVKWKNGSVTLSGGAKYELLGALYYFINSSGGASSFNSDVPIYCPVMEKR